MLEYVGGRAYIMEGTTGHVQLVTWLLSLGSWFVVKTGEPVPGRFNFNSISTVYTYIHTLYLKNK